MMMMIVIMIIILLSFRAHLVSGPTNRLLASFPSYEKSSSQFRGHVWSTNGVLRTLLTI